MKKKILVPTDFSKNAWNALTYATKLYKNESCDFYILHAFHATGYALESMMVPEPGEKFYEIAREASEKGLAKIMTQVSLLEENENHRFHTISSFSGLLEAIKNTIERVDIEMVIMGTKGTTNSSDVIYGTNTILVMEKSRNCPVMAIPEGVSYKEPKEIVFPTDYRMNIKRRELQYVIELARISNATVCILYMSKGDELDREQKENKKLLEEYFDGLEYSFHTLHDVDVKSGLSSFVESRGSDLITFINKKHSFFGSIFSRPMVKNLGYYSKVPVLALHDLRN
ncbi:universal stress protein [Aquimarina addita]|uniref:Universal stress protein n=1 Tax=Aquimarina addita TaxID=870485 RepID=A0ABP7XDA5_9FLAO